VRHEIDYHGEVAEGSLVELTAKLVKLGNKLLRYNMICIMLPLMS
jgi:acyl-CoA thioesterase FadM